jgi:hypothetical protein
MEGYKRLKLTSVDLRLSQTWRLLPRRNWRQRQRRRAAVFGGKGVSRGNHRAPSGTGNGAFRGRGGPGVRGSAPRRTDGSRNSWYGFEDLILFAVLFHQVTDVDDALEAGVGMFLTGFEEVISVRTERTSKRITPDRNFSMPWS